MNLHAFLTKPRLPGRWVGSLGYRTEITVTLNGVWVYLTQAHNAVCIYKLQIINHRGEW